MDGEDMNREYPPSLINIFYGMAKGIIELKKEYDLVEDDATDDKMFNWYMWALENGHCHVEYDHNGNLIGYAEWVRLRDIPKTKNIKDKVDWCVAKSAPVLFVMNMIATKPDILWKLRGRILGERDWEYIVWHSKRRDKMIVLKNGKRRK